MEREKKKRKKSAKLKGLTPKQGLCPFYSVAMYENTLAAGTKSNIFLWDLRTSAPLGVLTDFHSEVVTQLYFHFELSKSSGYPVLFSGGEDGLICQFNLNETDLDETLENVLSDEQSIRKIGFFGPQNEYLWSLSQIETVSLWDIEKAEKVGSFTEVRDRLSEEIKRARSRTEINYMVTCLYHRVSERLYLVAGSNSGVTALCHVNKTCIQICGLDERESVFADKQDEKTQDREAGHRDVLRDCMILGPYLITSGHDGRVCVWSPPSTSAQSDSRRK